MKAYLVMWTYHANYSSKPIPVQAENPEDAAAQLLDAMSDDFKKNASVFVFSPDSLLHQIRPAARQH